MEHLAFFQEENKNLLKEAECPKNPLKPYEFQGPMKSGARERLRALDQARLATVEDLVASTILILRDAKERQFRIPIAFCLYLQIPGLFLFLRILN